MLIVHLEPPNFGNQGDHVYRTTQPCRGLGTLDHITVINGTMLSPVIHELMQMADVLVLCKATDPDLLPLLKRRDANGLLNVYEINDDFSAIQSWNPTAAFSEQPINRSLTYQLAAQSHCTQVSAPELKRRYGELSKPCEVFRNHLWTVPESREKKGEITIGWGGSIGHLKDIAWIQPALKQLLDKYPHVKLKIMGYNKIRELFSWAGPHRVHFTEPGTLDQYNEFLQSLHIGLAPLLPTEFNRCRSDVKFLEYAAAGLATVCSSLEPYKDTVEDGKTGLLFQGLDDFAKCIERLIEDDRLRSDISRNAYQYVSSERLENQHIRGRFDFYKEQLAAIQNPTSAKKDMDGQMATQLLRRHGSFSKSPDTKHYSLEYGELEKLILLGLDKQQDKSEALRHFKEARRLAPDFYLVHLYSGAIDPSLDQGAESLAHAIELNPSSCAAAFHMGLKYLNAGENIRAKESFVRTLEIAPDFAPARECLGRLAEQSGRLEDACAHYEQALAANRFYRQSATRLAMIHRDREQIDKTIQLLLENIEIEKKSWLDHFLLGQTYNDLNDYENARRHLENALAHTNEPTPVLAQLAKAYLGCGDRAKAGQILRKLKGSI
ncbi:MAG: glycosyltransferase [Deltaproteobacteria bacterium]|nr:glycosyltransferase [Deltaproteobacteria bacterium]